MILDAAREVMVERGIDAARVTDVAERAGVSHGLVHYYFPTKDDLVAATMRHAAGVGVERLRTRVAARTNAVDKLDTLLQLAIPSGPSASDAWVLWVDAWSAGLRDETVRHVHEELDHAWASTLVEIIDDGVTTGEFTCSDPQQTAMVLTSLIDGLALRLVLRRRGVTRAEILRLLRATAAAELGRPTT
jgi:AcrR family transcriptional regulator